MIPSLKSEFKKLLTVRSTYGWVLLALVIVGIYSFYGEGFQDASNFLKNLPPGQGASLFLAGTLTQMSTFISLFGGIISLLLITHEYRHNTITYTLTAANSRTKVLASKFLAVMGFVGVYAICLTAIGLGLIFAGLEFAHHTLPHQDINYLTYVGKSLFYAEAYALAALLFGVIIRNQVGAFVALLIIPGAFEALLGLLLRHDSVYLPFMALQQVIQGPVVPGSHPAHPDNNMGSLTAVHGAEVFLIYFVIGWAIGWYLFLKRDAT